MRLAHTDGKTVTAVVQDPSTGEVWYPTGEVFEDFGTGSRTQSDYAIAMTPYSGNLYLGDFPSEIDEGSYIVQYYDSAVLIDDNEQLITWTGSSVAAAAVSELGLTEICNWAFIKVGGAKEARRIASYSATGDDNAQLCRDVCPLVRQSLLQKFGWLDAQGYADLGAELSGSSLIEGGDWDYQFNLPDDCLWVIRQTDEDDLSLEYAYEIKQGILLTDTYTNTDEDSVYIEYIKDEGTMSMFMPLFIEAFATKLAAELASVLNPEKELALRQQFERLDLPEAMDANQSQVYVEDEEGECRCLDARTS